MVMSMYSAIPCAVGRECLLWSVHSFGKTLVAFALFHFVLQSQTCLLFQVSLEFILLHSSPLWWRGHLFFGVNSRSSCKSSNLQLCSSTSSSSTSSTWGIDLNYCDLNGSSWSQIEIILLFLRLHPRTAFWTLLLTIMTTTFLLGDSWHSSRYNGHLN